jgi:hypothetical protein
MTRRPFALALLFAAAVAGCPGSLDDPDRFSAQFGTCPDMPAFFGKTCAVATCHAAKNPSAGLDLESDDIAGRLTGKMATGSSGLLIDPSSPSESVLYTKVTDSPPSGARMPLGGDPLDDAMVGCVLTWIESSTKGGSP